MSSSITRVFTSPQTLNTAASDQTTLAARPQMPHTWLMALVELVHVTLAEAERCKQVCPLLEILKLTHSHTIFMVNHHGYNERKINLLQYTLQWRGEMKKEIYDTTCIMCKQMHTLLIIYYTVLYRSYLFQRQCVILKELIFGTG
jgi:hypothetical protein